MQALRRSALSMALRRSGRPMRTTATPSGSGLMGADPTDPTLADRRPMRVVAGTAGGRRLVAPPRDRHPARRPTGCGRRRSTPSAAWARSTARRCSTSSPGAARSASRRCPRGARACTFVERGPRRRGGGRGQPATHRAGRTGADGASAATSLAHLARPPTRLRPGPARSALRHRRAGSRSWRGRRPGSPTAGVVVVESDRPVVPERRPAGRSSGEALRRYGGPGDQPARPAPPDQVAQPRDATVLYPGVVRPGPQRPPRDHRGRRPRCSTTWSSRPCATRRRASRCSTSTSARTMIEESVAHLANVEVDELLEPGRRPGQGGGRRLHHQGPARGVRLRVRDAPGPDEPGHLRGPHGLHPVRHRRTRSSRRSCIREIARFGGDVTSMVPDAGGQATRREVRDVTLQRRPPHRRRGERPARPAPPRRSREPSPAPRPTPCCAAPPTWSARPARCRCRRR